MTEAAKRYVCIHGHFYQPPRENPWLEAIERQDSAEPFHDWNERITAECYRPNATSRILDEEGRIARIVNNYARMSFNFGPTLLSWLSAHAPEVHEAVVEADRHSRLRHEGHGAAMAQVYNHMILPLASPRDRVTQVRWGIRDFEHRFGRRPEGMWLPETAVDLESLEVLAEHGIAFTLLAPRQAKRVRKIGEEAWTDVDGSRVDPLRPYVLRLASGRSIAIFFYDGPVSQAVAFERLLNDGERFANRILDLLTDADDEPRLAHIATDGESYGHHHPLGDMALASALERLDANPEVELTNYAAFLARHPPTHEVEILENTSWSCAHGVERWRSDCSCRATGNPWNQAWRGPLREALDWLRDAVAPRYEEAAGTLLGDPWAARDGYVEVVLDRGDEAVERFFRAHAPRSLSAEERTRALELLELQRHAMLMYTSCGWFFDELSGIETVQVIQYAGRVVQLAEELFGTGFEAPFLERLARAKSNLSSEGDGARIYTSRVKEAMVDLPWVAAHYAVSSLFERYGQQTRIYAFDLESEHVELLRAGQSQLAIGRVHVRSQVTLEGQTLSYAVLHLGDHNLHGGVRRFGGAEPFEDLARGLREAFHRPDLPATIHMIDEQFGSETYALHSLFHDEQRRVLEKLLERNLEEAQAALRQLYERFAPLNRFLADRRMPRPRVLSLMSDVVVGSSLRQELEREDLDPLRVEGWLDEAKREGLRLDAAGLAYVFGRGMEERMRAFAASPADLDLLARVELDQRVVGKLPFDVDRRQVQNLYYALVHEALPAARARADHGDAEAADWVARFTALGSELAVRVE